MRIGFVTFLAAALLTLAGCGGGGETKTVTVPAATPATGGGATTTSAAPATTPAAPATTPAAPATTTAEMGGTKVLLGNNNAKIEFTPVKWMDPIKPGQYDQPDPGQRLVGFIWKMKNVGQTTYDSSPGNGAALIMADGTRIDHVITGSSTTDCDYSSKLNLRPGETATGCIPFQVGEKAKIKELEYALNSGYADQKERWAIP